MSVSHIDALQRIARTGGAGEAAAQPQAGAFNRLMEQQNAATDLTPNLPALPKELSARESQFVEVRFQKDWNQHGTAMLQNVIQPDVNAANTELSSARAEMKYVPNSREFAPVRDMLSRVETQWDTIQARMDAVGQQSLTAASQGNYLELMKEVFQYQRNVSVFSSVVQEVSSGVRKVLDVQI